MNIWSDPDRSSKIKKGDFYQNFAENHPDLKTSILEIKLNEAKDALGNLNLPGTQPLKHSPVVLGFGPVQSGKTLSMECVLALAIDNGFRLFIVTSTNNLSLLTQTSDRFRQDFGLDKEPLWGMRYVRTLIVDKASDGNHKKQIDEISENLEKYCVIVFVNKNIRLNGLKDIIGGLMDPLRPTRNPLHSNQILMFDDESDVGTVDGVQANNTEQLTYRLMKELREAAPNSSVFLSTASPWANFFAKRGDVFEIDHATFFTPGEEYCGLTSFLPNRANHGDPGLVFISDIPATNEWNNDPPASLREALAFFIIGCLHTINEYESEDFPDSFPRCMFVNPGHKQEDHHAKAKAALSRIIKIWQECGNTGDFGFLEKAYRVYQSRMAQSKMKHFPLDQLTKHWRNFFPYLVGPEIINSSSPHRDIAGFQSKSRFQIFVGHRILSRGITLKGLTVSYYSNPPSTQTDTLYQSARFLGYRQKYKNLCGVFLTPHMLEAFEVYRLIEDIFIERTKTYNTRPPKDKSWDVFVDELLEELTAMVTEDDINRRRILTAVRKQHRFRIGKVTVKGWVHIWIELTEDVDSLLRQLMSRIKDCSLSVEEVSTMGLHEDALAILSESGSGTYASLLNSMELCKYLDEFRSLEKLRKGTLKFWEPERDVQLEYLIELISSHQQKNALIFPIKSEFPDNTSLKTQIRNTVSVQQNPKGKAEQYLHGQLGENGIVSMQLHKFQPDNERQAGLNMLDINKKYLVLSILFPEDRTSARRIDEKKSQD